MLVKRSRFTDNSIAIIWLCFILKQNKDPACSGAGSDATGKDGFMTLRKVATWVPLLVLLSACSTMPANGAAADDPLEDFNRQVYAVNTAVDSVTFKPVAKAYKHITPAAARRGVSNVLGTIEEPWSGVNALAQGKVPRFFRALDRLLINTIFGFGGLADRAAEWGLPAQEEDLGQTLAVWGVPEGPYLMVPFFGPSNPRDLTGLIIQFFFDPNEFALKEADVSGLGRAELGTRVLNFRTEALDTADVLVATSTDPYAALKSAYRQQRAYEINDGKLSLEPGTNDMFEDDSDAPAAAAIEPESVSPQ